MSHPVLTPPSAALDVGELLENLAHAFAPIARSRGISPELSGVATPVLVTTSLEEVLPPFTTLWLKLLYLLTPGSRFEVAALMLTEADVARLRLQITTDPMWLNPNLLLSNTAKILQLDRSAVDSCVIYVDLLLDELPQPTQPSLASSWTLPEAMQSEKPAHRHPAAHRAVHARRPDHRQSTGRRQRRKMPRFWPQWVSSSTTAWIKPIWIR